jgi:hypothetical protein
LKLIPITERHGAHGHGNPPDSRNLSKRHPELWGSMLQLIGTVTVASNRVMFCTVFLNGSRAELAFGPTPRSTPLSLLFAGKSAPHPDSSSLLNSDRGDPPSLISRSRCGSTYPSLDPASGRITLTVNENRHSPLPCHKKSGNPLLLDERIHSESGTVTV